MADETEKRLAKMRRALAKLRREGREREFGAVASAYAALKAEQMARAEEEGRAAARARAEARRARVVRGRPVPSGVWRLPRGFASPLAAQRARGIGVPREEPSHPGYGLRPWRRSGGPMSEVIWRPGR